MDNHKHSWVMMGGKRPHAVCVECGKKRGLSSRVFKRQPAPPNWAFVLDMGRERIPAWKKAGEKDA